MTRARSGSATKRTARTNGRRRYRSTLRARQAEQTRRAVLDAARELFLTKGWAGTGMREVAARAEVATETVYSHFSSKLGLLRAIADESAVGDDAPVPLAERPEFLAIGRGPRATRIQRIARLLTPLQRRTAPIARLLRQAAPADDDIAQMLHETRERQRVDVEAGLALVLERRPTATERDGVWAITSPDVYLLLVEESGWTAEEYEEWITSTLTQVIPRS